MTSIKKIAALTVMAIAALSPQMSSAAVLATWRGITIIATGDQISFIANDNNNTIGIQRTGSNKWFLALYNNNLQQVDGVTITNDGGALNRAVVDLRGGDDRLIIGRDSNGNVPQEVFVMGRGGRDGLRNYETRTSIRRSEMEYNF